jgi:hypothetical protein
VRFLAAHKAQSPPDVAEGTAVPRLSEPLVWPVIAKSQPGIRSFDGHTDAVPDIVGRIWDTAELYQCARKSASTVAAPEIIAAMMATDGTAPFGSSRLTSDARKIAVTGNAITK